MRFKFHIAKSSFVSVILLTAILSGAFSLVFSAPATASSAEMVYCPLTRKLQPISPPKAVLPANSLAEICAGEFEKNNFTLAILKSANHNTSNISQTDFENLAFDFWRNGKSAFDNLPDIPNLPEKLSVKNSYSAVNFGSNFENKIFRKTAENFAFQLKPRPPTAPHSFAFESENLPNLSQIPRQISPRAPPALV